MVTGSGSESRNSQTDLHRQAGTGPNGDSVKRGPVATAHETWSRTASAVVQKMRSILEKVSEQRSR